VKPDVMEVKDLEAKNTVGKYLITLLYHGNG